MEVAATSHCESDEAEVHTVGNRLRISLKLAGLPDDATLELCLPLPAASLNLSDLVDCIFPADEVGRCSIQESFDLEANPDLPEIYEIFFIVVEQSRSGLCRLDLSRQPDGMSTHDGTIADFQVGQRNTDLGSSGSVSLLLTPGYDALEYAAAQGFDAGEPDLLEWLQLCSVIYFLDKHEARLDTPGSWGSNISLGETVNRVLHLGLAAPSVDEGPFELTSEGRVFIGQLLAETESYIDRYDLFGDVVWDDEAGQALFGTSHGEDLRVETFIAEALDPIRAVFLLRLYDGTLDEYANDWNGLVGSRDFYNRLLEPVVDRSVTPDDLLDEILDQGFSLLEVSRQQETLRDSNVRVARIAAKAPDSFPP